MTSLGHSCDVTCIHDVTLDDVALSFHVKLTLSNQILRWRIVQFDRSDFREKSVGGDLVDDVITP